MVDQRDIFYQELLGELERRGIRAIIKVNNPVNGNVIKLNGVALYKVLKTPNPFGSSSGVAIYRKLTDKAIEEVGGKRVKGKNRWVGTKLHNGNYDKLMRILVAVADTSNYHRSEKMAKKKNSYVDKSIRLSDLKVRKEKTIEEMIEWKEDKKKPERKVKPKKRRVS